MILDVAEMREICKIESDADEHILYQLILSAQKIAEKYCDTVLELTEGIVEYLNGSGTEHLLLKNFPVTEITSIYDDPDRVYPSSCLVPTTDYTFEDSGSVQNEGFWSKGNKNIKVTYSAGLDVVPYDLKQAVAWLALASHIEASGGINVIQGQDFIYKPKKLRDDAYLTLDRYRKMM